MQADSSVSNKPRETSKLIREPLQVSSKEPAYKDSMNRYEKLENLASNQLIKKSLDVYLEKDELSSSLEEEESFPAPLDSI